VLANLWKEEEARTKTLEDKMRLLLKDKEVSRLDACIVLILSYFNKVVIIVVVIVVILLVAISHSHSDYKIFI